MDSLIDQINEKNVWIEYLDFKRKQASMSKKEIEVIERYIKQQKYEEIAEKILSGEYEFSIPEKHLINKINKSKKRVVYNFNEDENMILKLITFLFSKKYDEKYSENCYSFRRKYTVKDAIKKLSKSGKVNTLYGYKIDIENYFNSINIEILLEKLQKFISDDSKLFEFIKSILSDNRVIFNGYVIRECKGIMAGVPISSFLANIYLMEVDDFFKNEEVLYIRYSDDIIFFAEKEKLEFYMHRLNELVESNKLSLNAKKIQKIKPGDKWDFLGFSYQNGTIDISEIARMKIKGKIKRTSRKLRRWMIKNDATSQRAIAAVIRKFNRKFYTIENKNELTWQLWYFPIINTTEGLHEIDVYMQSCLRYIKTGKYGKRNYNTKYSELKELGYRPLVSEYYAFRDTFQKHGFK